MCGIAAICAAIVVWTLTTGGFAVQSDRSLQPDFAISENSDSKPHASSSSGEPSREPPLTRPKTWDLSIWVNEAVGNSANGDVGDAYMSMAGFRTGYVLARPDLHGRLQGTLEYFFDIIPVFVLTKPKAIYGGGLPPIGFKWNFTGGRRHPFVETSLGGMLSTENVPPGDTSNFNFTVSCRGGLTLASRPRNSLTASVGFWHLSNAHMGNTNPSLNAFQFGVEYHWFKLR